MYEVNKNILESFGMDQMISSSDQMISSSNLYSTTNLFDDYNHSMLTEIIKG